MFQRQPWMQRAGEYPGSDQEYFALLARAVFSAGLGPRVVEARWPCLVQAFAGLDPAKVAMMDESDVARLLSDPGVIRNRRKIEAVISNAQVCLDVVAAEGGLHAYFQRLAAERSFGSMVDEVSDRFTHVGPTSAALFLFSAGWREETVCADGQPEPDTSDGGQPAAEKTGVEGARSPRRRRAAAGTETPAASPA